MNIDSPLNGRTSVRILSRWKYPKCSRVRIGLIEIKSVADSCTEPRISMGRQVLGTASALRLVARLNVALAVGFLAYDATSIGMCMIEE